MRRARPVVAAPAALAGTTPTAPVFPSAVPSQPGAIGGTVVLLGAVLPLLMCTRGRSGRVHVTA